jgi:hypothetical protein
MDQTVTQTVAKTHQAMRAAEPIKPRALEIEKTKT